jgi:hypothetical protein
LWAELVEPEAASEGAVFVAVEDDYGLGAAVAAVGRMADGRLEVDGWKAADWDSAIAGVQALAGVRPIRSLLVGASLMDRIRPGMGLRPAAAGGKETRTGLAVLRDLAHAGLVCHDEGTFDVDDALTSAMVREAPTGLMLAAKGPTHLVRAVAWAVGAAHRPQPAPAVR